MIQNGTVKTVADLQKFPIELHVNGLCTDATNVVCQASNTYVNEDGISKNFHDTYTEYDISFHTFQGGQWRLEFSNKQNRATEVNANDFVGRVEIYNAASLGLNNTYTADLELEGSTTDTELPNKAEYDSYTDRLVWNASSATEVSLLKAGVLKFIKSVDPPPLLRED